MFNLLMADVDRPLGRVTVPMLRMFGYIDDHFTEQFREGGNPLLDRLATQSEHDIPFELRHLAGIARSGGKMSRT